MIKSILVVCVGNICRSPLGATLIKYNTANIKVSSAGIAALVGKSADKNIVDISAKRGLDLKGHVAVQITRDLCLLHDLILVMEKKQIDFITKFSPESRGKVMLFGHWDKEIEIPDPYRKSRDFAETVFLLLEKSSFKWSQVLNK